MHPIEKFRKYLKHKDEKEKWYQKCGKRYSEKPINKEYFGTTTIHINEEDEEDEEDDENGSN
jgi:hypothetical protein